MKRAPSIIYHYKKRVSVSVVSTCSFCSLPVVRRCADQPGAFWDDDLSLREAPGCSSVSVPFGMLAVTTEAETGDGGCSKETEIDGGETG